MKHNNCTQTQPWAQRSQLPPGEVSVSPAQTMCHNQSPLWISLSHHPGKLDGLCLYPFCKCQALMPSNGSRLRAKCSKASALPHQEDWVSLLAHPSSFGCHLSLTLTHCALLISYWFEVRNAQKGEIEPRTQIGPISHLHKENDTCRWICGELVSATKAFGPNFLHPLVGAGHFQLQCRELTSIISIRPVFWEQTQVLSQWVALPKRVHPTYQSISRYCHKIPEVEYL